MCSRIYCILFDGDNTKVLSEVDQEVSVEDILGRPVSIDIGGNNLTLCLETLCTHGVEKALNFVLVGGGPVSLEETQYFLYSERKGFYLVSVPVGEIKIGFITGLETKESVTKNFLALLNNIQPPVSCVKEWDTFGLECERYPGKEQRWDSPRNQSTLTRLLMLAIIYKISGVNTRGGVCVCGAINTGEMERREDNTGL